MARIIITQTHQTAISESPISCPRQAGGECIPREANYPRARIVDPASNVARQRDPAP
jgi:hypothetical protein